jgi:hypothetical protein
MSSLIYFAICGAVLVLIALTALFIFVRAARMSTPAHWPRLGWIAVVLYLCSTLAAHLFLWRFDTEDVLLATMLFGMPWSAIGMFVLRSGLVGATWEPTSVIAILSLVGIGLNSWLVYQLGQRLPLGKMPQHRAANHLPP